MAEFRLPEVGEGIESGTVVSVLVSVGDRVEVDQSLLELETDKAVVEVPASSAGVVEAIYVKEGDEAAIGSAVMLIGEGASAPASAEAPTEAAEAVAAASATDVALPEVGEGIESGTVVSVLVAVGDSVEADQSILELETDKAVVEVPAPVAGTVVSINVSEGAEAAIGQVVMSISAGGAAPAAPPAASTPAPAASAPAAPASSPAPAAPQPVSVGTAITNRSSIPAAPSVRRIARELNVDLAHVAGSGLLGRISAEDVKRIAEGGAVTRGASAAPATAGVGRPEVKLPDFSKWGPIERKAMSGIRKATARQMDLSWSHVPMVTQFDKCDITELEKLRKAYAKRVERGGGGKLTPTAIIAKVVASALEKFPDFNASIDMGNQEVVYKQYVHLGIAVDTPRGLIVPVIRDANQKNIIEISASLNDIAERGRAGKIKPDEMQGGTFSISNLGGIGGTGFTPIVNHPEVAILGIARGTWEPRLDDDGAFTPRLMMPVSLSYDHRLIDGASAARFTRWICEALETPFVMMLEG